MYTLDIVVGSHIQTMNTPLYKRNFPGRAIWSVHGAYPGRIPGAEIRTVLSLQ
jgi:hypothetical protein